MKCRSFPRSPAGPRPRLEPPCALHDLRLMILSEDEWARVREQAEAEYPAECCGVLLTRADAEPHRLLLPCKNVQNELHAKDPQRHPRDARTAYFIDPKDLLAIGRREGQGYGVDVIYHSHIDAGAYFSATDKQNALMNGEPFYPAATYVVVSVMEGKVADIRAFVWTPAARDFVECPM